MRANRPAVLATLFLAILTPPAATRGQSIVHDGEYEFVASQHAEAWAKEDREVDARLARIREGNGGKPPNIL